MLISKSKEVLMSVLPIPLLVSLLHFTVTPLGTSGFISFLLGAVCITIGLTIFLIGVDIGITPIGHTMANSIAKSNQLWIIIIGGLALGFFISIAEPDLHILAEQVDSVSAGLIDQWNLVIVVSLGIAILLTLGLLRIVFKIPLYLLLLAIYGVILIISLFIPKAFLAVAFDASGATTGALTVPFILAFATGISRMEKDGKGSEKDSFGLVAIASTGAIISVMLMSILSGTKELTGVVEEAELGQSIIATYVHEIPKIAKDVGIALFPVVFIFFIFQYIRFRLSRLVLRKIMFGVLYTFLGLVIFLTGVNAGFMEVGKEVGYGIASMNHPAYIIGLGFLLGFLTILAEPAVYVLTDQIEDVTSGYVKKKVVMFTLAFGVGLAVALSMVRILIPELQLWQYLLPGYLLASVLMFFAPKLFVGIAFDSGGVASGPMTATFILAFAQGVAQSTDGANALLDGFGVIAMVAMTPLIALQVLGVIFRIKSRKGTVKTDGK